MMAGAVTFTRKTVTIDKTTGRPTTVTTTMIGEAVQKPGDPKRYEALKLRQADTKTLKWCPDDYSVTPTPEPGDTCVWKGKTWTAADVTEINPDGLGAITADIIITV